MSYSVCVVVLWRFAGFYIPMWDCGRLSMVRLETALLKVEEGA